MGAVISYTPRRAPRVRANWCVDYTGGAVVSTGLLSIASSERSRWRAADAGHRLWALNRGRRRSDTCQPRTGARGPCADEIDRADLGEPMEPGVEPALEAGRLDSGVR